MAVVLRSVPRFEKYPNEVITQAVDFVEVLDAGETITTSSVTAVRLDTGASASEVLNGGSSINGTTVSYQVANGTASISYILSVNATLDSSEIYTQKIQMNVVEIPE